jgi:hypothetical protein
MNQFDDTPNHLKLAIIAVVFGAAVVIAFAISWYLNYGG